MKKYKKSQKIAFFWGLLSHYNSKLGHLGIYNLEVIMGKKNYGSCYGEPYQDLDI